MPASRSIFGSAPAPMLQRSGRPDKAIHPPDCGASLGGASVSMLRQVVALRSEPLQRQRRHELPPELLPHLSLLNGGILVVIVPNEFPESFHRPADRDLP